jgi:hypothetical protein
MLLVIIGSIFILNSAYGGENQYTYTVPAPARTNCQKTCSDPRLRGINYCENRGPSNEFWSQRNKDGYRTAEVLCDWHDITADGNKVKPGDGDATCICEYQPN